jgi:alpha/beta superfamily hydrolase
MSFLDIPVPHGQLEALWWHVDSPNTAVIVCHPHPLHGGTMHNHVTYRVARAFHEQGASVLRFNFRGVGRSTGAYDEGRGEVEDARAGLAFLAGKYPGVPLGAAGFSFGARVALRLAEDPRVRYALAVGLAVKLFDFTFVKQLQKPKAFVQGDRDEYGALDEVRALVAESPPPRELFVVENCDHLCTGRLEELELVASKAVTWLLGEAQIHRPSEAAFVG